MLILTWSPNVSRSVSSCLLNNLPDGYPQTTSKYRNDRKQYPHTLEDFTDRDWKHYGKEYLDQIAHHRIENKPYFIDKLPNNFNHVGWIKTILPNAKIIVTQKHPIHNCLEAN